VVVGVGVEVPEDVEGELAGGLEDDAGEGAGVGLDDGLGVLSFLSSAGFSPAACTVGSLPVGGLSLSE
jgi:hypothetical protein